MKLSSLFLHTKREIPSDADTVSHILMIRSGMIRKLTSGSYEWMPLGLRTLRKVEQIIREEMDRINGQEVSLPLLLPKELWMETGRWNVYGKELFRLKDRKDAEFCLGPTHEEIITDIVRNEVRSYKELPLMLYQFGAKFRDEIRPRFGVMRAKEFLMKDAYSFHADEQDTDSYYQQVFEAYNKICTRCGFKYRAVEATTGAIGGKFSHEFMVLAETGEEEIVWCTECGWASNTEKAGCLPPIQQGNTDELLKPEEVHTPNMRTVEEVAAFLKAAPDKFIKSLIYLADNIPVMVLIQGIYEINEHKLMEHLGCTELMLAGPKTIETVTGAPLGFAGPVNLPDKVKIVADHTVAALQNAISGANKKDYHIKNININKDFIPESVTDLRKIIKTDTCPGCKKPVTFNRGIEVGHTFKLGTKYSKSMKATFLDKNGKEQFYIMGCYGIGVSRIVAAVIEQSNDTNGIIWPVNLAPFTVIITPVDYKDVKLKEVSDSVYKKLQENNIDVLLDDRDERPGVKFKDADLTGIPVRITVSKKTVENNQVEFKLRKSPDMKMIDIPKIIETTTYELSHY